MTVFNRIKTMSKPELQQLIYCIYLWGHLNEQCNCDDEALYQMLLDLDAHYCDDIVKSFAKVNPIKVRVIPIDGDEPHYLSTKFFSMDDATQYLTKHILNLVKIDNTTYATPTTIYKLMPCDGGKLS